MSGIATLGGSEFNHTITCMMPTLAVLDNDNIDEGISQRWLAVCSVPTFF